MGLLLAANMPDTLVVELVAVGAEFVRLGAVLIS